MGVLSDYFIAKDDAMAATVATWEGGPKRPPVMKGGLFRRSKPALDLPLVIDLKGIEPVVNLGTLEALITGESFESVLDSFPQDPLGDEAEDAESWVVPVRPRLVQLLADLGSDAAASTYAVPWAQTEELAGIPPEVLAGVIARLTAMCDLATRQRWKVYCWISL